ncbi:serine/threonine-protein kinase [Actinokineospora diospyrosa]|uniref:Serine/threonine protein kinase n=1 Tax=Actinokineospora diospyrosa TaxID=103728 RepID=A0ABT1I9K5_9PSEU|nr:serine/threonine-protein kinase [Actinokineospora diospyrosa]MCP2269318.1 Serine/threonine protein kinase [Actinokineospora diospyrosa]
MVRALGSQYTLGELLGSGAMGQVYRGADHEGNQYAFKLLRGDLVDDKDFVARFHQERSILVTLRGENLVAVHDLVIEGSTAAIVMDLVSGGTLREQLTATGPILPAEVARIGSGIANALHEVHQAGIVHRDVKPENVLMDDAAPIRTPRLTDFGIAKMAEGSRVGRSTLMAGTPQYVAPEVADGQSVTPAADLYSLGITLYEMCCGVTPFHGETVLQVLRSHAEKLPGRPDGIPDELWEVIWGLLQKNPAARPRSAAQVSAALGSLAQRFWQAQIPVAPRLQAPPAGVPMGQGNTNETVLRMPGPVTPPVARKKRKRLPLIALAAALLAVAAGGGWALATRENSASPAGVQTGGSSEENTETTTRSGKTTTTAQRTTRPEIRLESMPDLVGLKLGEARDKLPQSMEVEIVDQIDDKKADGTVLGQEPAAGEKVDGKAKLIVARPAVTVYFDELPTTAGGWSQKGPAAMDGKQYLHSLSYGGDSYCTRETRTAEYNLSKGFRRGLATVGLSDDSEVTDFTLQLEVFADGRQLTSVRIEFGKVVPLELDLTNVLRLKFQWIVTSTTKTCGRNSLVLGEAKLLGLASEVPVSGLPPRPSTTPNGSSSPTTTTTG